ncbi:hypothetical protein ANCCEY_01749 [Ancylostoma ceylanicum]|uniref:Protein kinase domain-containing protein n=1 Tax=Ancylostoma ceylanicum TaxID=53326 RepID=A0A0D6M4P1_9BILA|nr:hypothetical protein ANCCEY_01749 [Ancylostoma ceylanicum]
MVKLSDFGQVAHGRRILLPSNYKMPVRWQAPEVLIHRVYLRESDVWSYGMVMSEIYNDGKPPFHDKTTAQIFSKIHDPEFRPLLPNLPLYPDIPEIMHQCWQINVMKRPKMHEVAQLLRGYCIHRSLKNPYFRSVTEKCDTHCDAKQRFMERAKSHGVGESATFVSRTFQKKSWMPACKSAIASTQIASVNSKSLSLQLQPAMVDEKEAAKVHSKHQVPYIPYPARQNKSTHTGIVATQPSDMTCQLRNGREPRRAKSPNKACK